MSFPPLFGFVLAAALIITVLPAAASLTPEQIATVVQSPSGMTRSISELASPKSMTP